ncbi:putative aldouronate transport system permease protein [Paenibacillus sp. UNCCL117]|uniref:ABC transporter permease n=1 Tax=unclassified Paenibacillus TaxID=185978 RepID=UPI00088C853A|nr:MULTISPECIES: ABC transporter permease subunit [unclassified Paenibacillus]SDD07398.1 putative aldouronate transport system permease protein [Paenibacillus sp. cl123]SFW31474.1 putative aldouronate transport system permease protein [Paenibacillus sp. UNCCL117]
MHTEISAPRTARRESAGLRKLWKLVSINRFYYLLIIPGMLYFIIFDYIPMFGVIIAFKDISPFEGVEAVLTGEWVGFKHFIKFWNSYYFWNVMRNTLLISMYKLVIGFPASIVLALLLNELKNAVFKRVVQTISYLPHFISTVVVAGLIMMVLSTDSGMINAAVVAFGGEPIHFLGSPEYFRSILVASHVWQSIGWGSILYLAAMTSIDPGLYEAAKMDGASRLRQMWHITLPGITHVIVIMLIFSIGGLLNAGFEKVLLLYSPSVYEVADIIDTYVYREGLTSLQYSFATAVGLFKNILAMILILGANYIAKKMNQTGIW